MNKTTTYFYAFLAMLFWGLSFIWIKMAYEYYGPMTTIFLRLSIAAVILSFVLQLRKRRSKIGKEDIKFFLALAFAEPFCYFLGESFGMLYVSSTLASILISTIPLFTPFFAYIFYREKVTPMNVIGFMVSFIGILVMVVDGSSSMAASGLGILLMLVAVFSAVGHGLILKHLAERYDSLTIVSWQNIIGALYFLPIFLATEWQLFLSVKPTISLVLIILQLSLFASVLSFLFFIRVIRQLGLSKAAVFTNLIPLITAFFSFILLDEVFTPIKIAGMLVVIFGLFLSQLGAKFFYPSNRPVEDISLVLEKESQQ